AVYDGCPKLEYLGTSECWNILDTDLVDKINARSGWENVDVSQDYSDDSIDNSDNGDSAVYTNFARWFQRSSGGHD
ncbi:hypothetical protein GGI20_002995, partial [Coemansia sp. BCRC 34301]